MEKTSWARAMRIAGAILVLAALYFVARRLWSARDALSVWQPSWYLICALAAGGLLQGAGGFLLSGSWARLLGWCTEREPDWAACHRLYGRTQIGKYIPGNVFHFVGRHVSGRLEDYSHRGLLCALTAENVLLLLAAGLVALPAAFALLAEFDAAPRLLRWTAVGVLLLGVIAVTWYGSQQSAVDSRQLVAARIFSRLYNVVFAAVLFRYLVFFHVMGALLVVLLCLVQGWPGLWLAELLVGGVALSWLAGFATPGAPAGLGVREAVLLLLLEPIAGRTQGLLLVLLFRLLTVIGDVCFFILAGLVGRPLAESSTTVEKRRET